MLEEPSGKNHDKCPLIHGNINLLKNKRTVIIALNHIIQWRFQFLLAQNKYSTNRVYTHENCILMTAEYISILIKIYIIY